MENIIKLDFNKMQDFEIWDKINHEVCHIMKETFYMDFFMSEDDFEEITWDGLFEFRYVYSAQPINTFDELRQLLN